MPDVVTIREGGEKISQKACVVFRQLSELLKGNFAVLPFVRKALPLMELTTSFFLLLKTLFSVFIVSPRGLFHKCI